MNNPQITSIHLHLEGHAKATIKCPDSTEINIEIPREALEGKSMDDRYAAINQRAHRYIACLVKENEVVAGPFTAPVTIGPSLNVQAKTMENFHNDFTRRMDEKFTRVSDREISTQAVLNSNIARVEVMVADVVDFEPMPFGFHSIDCK